MLCSPTKLSRLLILMVYSLWKYSLICLELPRCHSLIILPPPPPPILFFKCVSFRTLNHSYLHLFFFNFIPVFSNPSVCPWWAAFSAYGPSLENKIHISRIMLKFFSHFIFINKKVLYLHLDLKRIFLIPKREFD